MSETHLISSHPIFLLFDLSQRNPNFYKYTLFFLGFIIAAGLTFAASYGFLNLSLPLMITFSLGSATLVGTAILVADKIYEKIKLNNYTSTPYRIAAAPDYPTIYLQKSNQPLFQSIIDDFKMQHWFVEWKAKMQFTTDQDVFNYFWKFFDEGLCAGLCVHLNQIINAEPQITTGQLLDKVEMKEVLKYHMLWTIAADLCTHKCFESFERVKELLGLKESDVLDVKLDSEKEVLTYYLQNRLNQHGSLRFHVDIEYNSDHLFYVCAENGRYFLFDSYSEFTGLYTFPDSQTLFDCLYDHIHTYQNLKGYKFRFI